MARPMIPGAAARPRCVPRRAPDATVVLVRGDVEVATWTLGDCGRPDLDVVDELARLALTARRMGCSILLRHVGDQLSQLLDLVGLRQELLGVEVVGQTEVGEQVGVEEVVVPDDPVA